MMNCIVNFKVNIFPTPYELAEKLADEMVKMVGDLEKNMKPISIALSGGSTPELLYSVLGDHFSTSVRWEKIHFFWGDERCVPPDNSDSNYTMAKRSLLGRINIPDTNIHRIRGENDPFEEACRYSLEISENTRKRDGLPVFDLVILGLGEDGHTASIFPSDANLMHSEKICDVTSHPVSKQKRITLTGRIINNADMVAFLVTGRNKAEIVEKIINKSSTAQNFPAFSIVPVYGKVQWFLDKEAGSLL
jgi:6-phosphogluconolactonase